LLSNELGDKLSGQIRVVLAGISEAENEDGEGLDTLVERATNLRQTRNALNLSFLDHLGAYHDGPTLADNSFTQPPENAVNSILQKTTEQKPNLRVGDTEDARESGSKVEIRLTARYKPEDEDAHETDQGAIRRLKRCQCCASPTSPKPKLT